MRTSPSAPCQDCDDLSADLVRVMNQRNGGLAMLRMLVVGADTLATTIDRGTVEPRHADALRDLTRIAREWSTSEGFEVLDD